MHPPRTLSSTQTREADQRQHLRFELFEYALAYTFDEPDVAKQVVVVNIGLGGLQLRTRSKFAPGSYCSLEIPNAGRSISVEVRFCDALPGSTIYCVGMKFRPTDHDERIAIAQYVHRIFQSQRDMLTR